MDKKSEELLAAVNEILAEEGEELDIKSMDSRELLEKFILPGLKNSKNTMSSLYKYEPPKKVGPLGKVKWVILLKLRNIVFNIIEAQSMKQQKFNELTYQAIVQLLEENSIKNDKN